MKLLTMHCFLHCPRFKLVWFHFLPLLTSLLTSPFRPNCAFVFSYEFPTPHAKNLRLILYLIKSILYGVWKFRNKAVFHNGRENSTAIIKYITASVKGRILMDKHRFSPRISFAPCGSILQFAISEIMIIFFSFSSCL